MNPNRIINRIAFLLLVGSACVPLHGVDKVIEEAIIDLYGKPTVTVRSEKGEMELPAIRGRKETLVEGAMVTFGFEDRSAIFFETKKGEVKVFILQSANTMKESEIKDLQRFVNYELGDASIDTYVTADRRRFEAVSSRYLYQE